MTGNISDYTQKEDFKVGTVVLADGHGKNYKDVLKKAMKDGDIKDQAKEAMRNMKLFFKKLFEAEEATKKYIAQKNAGDVTEANKALKQYDQADDNLKKLLVSITPNKKLRAKETEART